MRTRVLTVLVALGLCAAWQPIPSAQTATTVDPALFHELQWRNIGPHRASRTKALDGVPSQPHTFYIGVVNGGVWKTTDAGRTWAPVFDQQSTGSIGALAVAPSDPNVIYVGTGEAQQRPDLATGDGMYKSTDAGKTWTHLGLRDTQQIAQVMVDPRDANRVFVAALGHPYGLSERGTAVRYLAVPVPSSMAAMKQRSVNGGMAAVATIPLLPLVGRANGSSVGGTSRPTASGHSAMTGFASTEEGARRCGLRPFLLAQVLIRTVHRSGSDHDDVNELAENRGLSGQCRGPGCVRAHVRHCERDTCEAR